MTKPRAGDGGTGQPRSALYAVLAKLLIILPADRSLFFEMDKRVILSVEDSDADFYLLQNGNQRG
jgi:hypothetical protein